MRNRLFHLLLDNLGIVVIDLAFCPNTNCQFFLSKLTHRIVSIIRHSYFRKSKFYRLSSSQLHVYAIRHSNRNQTAILQTTHAPHCTASNVLPSALRTSALKENDDGSPEPPLVGIY